MAERDKGYESYHRDLKGRYGLKDIHIAQGHMRASDPSWTGGRPEDVPHERGMTDVILVQDSATLTGAVKPDWIREMIPNGSINLPPGRMVRISGSSLAR